MVRYNVEGLAGLRDRPKRQLPQRLSEAEEAVFAAAMFRDLDPDVDSVSAWTRPTSARKAGSAIAGG
ncbi:MAG: hypothetical protein IPK66_08910 [Rhodospirillales bacterium]|nr:hypothetical protein [Rhodospirillales bacterium]